MSVRPAIWIAAGAVVAAGLAGCSEAPPAATAGNASTQAFSRQAEPKAAGPAAATEDENTVLAARVVAALRGDPAVGQLGIDVVSAEGAVTLFGTAPSNGDRDRAARVAASVDGVRSVMNNLVIVAGS